MFGREGLLQCCAGCVTAVIFLCVLLLEAAVQCNVVLAGNDEQFGFVKSA